MKCVRVYVMMPPTSLLRPRRSFTDVKLTSQPQMPHASRSSYLPSCLELLFLIILNSMSMDHILHHLLTPVNNTSHSYSLMPKFHYIYLAQNLLKTRSPTCFEQKKVGDLVSDNIDLYRHVEIDLAGLRHVCDFFEQDRSSGIYKRQAHRIFAAVDQSVASLL